MKSCQTDGKHANLLTQQQASDLCQGTQITLSAFKTLLLQSWDQQVHQEKKKNLQKVLNSVLIKKQTVNHTKILELEFGLM